MKARRARAHKRHMQLCTQRLGFRDPLQVVADAAFLAAASHLPTPLPQLLQRTLLATMEPKLMTTACAQAALRTAADAAGLGANPAGDGLRIAKTLERRRCPHHPPRTAAACITDIIGATNRHRYIIAAQDPALRAALRLVPGVPILFLHHGVLVLEKPSQATLDSLARAEHSKLSGTTTIIAPGHDASSYTQQHSSASGQSLNNNHNDNDDDDDDSDNDSNSSNEDATEKVTKSTSITSTNEKHTSSKKSHNANPLACKKKTAAADARKQRQKAAKKEKLLRLLQDDSI